MKRTVTQDGAPTRSVRGRRASRNYAGKGQMKIYRGPKAGSVLGVHQFAKSATVNVNVFDNGWGIGVTRGPAFGIQFNLSQYQFIITGGTSVSVNVPGFVELSALFDQIMLDKVVCKFTYMQDANLTGSVSAPPLMYHAEDLNDAGPPATLATIEQYGTVRSRVASVERGPIIRTIRPCYPQVVNGGGAGATFAAKRGFVSAISDIPHFGMKGYLNMINAGTGTNYYGTMIVEIRYFYKCKNQL